MSQFDGMLSDFQSSLITSGICATATESIYVRDQDDYKMSEKYVVEGGELTIYLTEIGSTLKNILKSKVK